MMDEFYEYWELIPEFDKYETVGKVRKADKVSEFLTRNDS